MRGSNEFKSFGAALTSPHTKLNASAKAYGMCSVNMMEYVPAMVCKQTSCR